MTNELPWEKDPIWQKTMEISDRMLTIRIVLFLGRLSDTMMFVGNLLDFYSKGGRVGLITSLDAGLPETLAMVPFNPDATPEDREKSIAILTNRWKESSLSKANQFERWIINYGYVALCTTLDGFLDDAATVLFKFKPDLVFNGSNDTKLNLKKIRELGSYEVVLDHFRQRALTAFSFSSIRARYNALEKTFGLSLASLFNFSTTTEPLRSQLAGHDLEKLVQIYQTRHRIVHGEELVPMTWDELEITMGFFQRLMFQVVWTAENTHQLYSEFRKNVFVAEIYRQLKEKEGLSSAAPPDAS